LITELKDNEYRLKRVEKKYDHNKKQIKDYENTIIEKELKIKKMEMQKKNDDLCSKMENDMPGGGFNELDGLEMGTNMMGNLNDSHLEPAD
jgi:hypothetical protein